MLGLVLERRFHYMKNFCILVATLTLCFVPVCGDDASGGAYNTTLLIGPGQQNQSSQFISAGTTISDTHADSVPCDPNSGFTNQEGFFCWVNDASPQLLSIQGNGYFVCIYNEQKTTFRVQDCDPYNTPVSTGYPMVSYWGYQISTTTLSLDLVAGTTNVYQKQIDLKCGTYNYQYIIKNIQMTSEVDLAVSSFVVTARPQNVQNTGLADASYTSNGKVVLNWSASNPDGTPLAYNLYLGTDPNNLPVCYQGGNSSFELDSLGYNQTYYWKVEAVNSAGVSSFSPVYSFITIKKVTAAFNYPNPFNPATGQNTKIVFNMAEAGSADIKIYTEMGHLCWSGSFDNLTVGANEVGYDGRDGSGRMMYNGTYPCVIMKKYPDRTEKDFCRLLIIK
jgi:hypothetical protein